MYFDFVSTIFNAIMLVIAIIAGIGPQNLNIISHAIRKNHAWSVATTCFLGDLVLILAGCIGVSFLGSHIVVKIINLVGITFLSYYVLLKIYGLNKPYNVKFDDNLVDKKTAIIRALALTWLNPLVFIDTIVIIGGTSANYTGLHHLAFTIGAITGDFIWLFGIAFIAHKFAHKLNRPIVWMCLDIATIILVAVILIKLMTFFI